MSQELRSSSTSIISQEVPSPNDSSLLSVFILRDDTETDPDKILDNDMDGHHYHKEPAFMAIHGNRPNPFYSTPQEKEELRPPSFSSGSVKLPALNDSNQLLLSNRPSPSMLYNSSHNSSTASMRNDARRQNSDKHNLWDQLNRSQFMKDELSKQFGEDTHSQPPHGWSPNGDDVSRRSLLDAIMNKRNKERMAKKEDFNRLLNDLNKQRQQLLEAKDRLADQRRNVMAHSPAFSYAGRSNTGDSDWDSFSRHTPLRRPDTNHDLRPVDTFIRQTEMNLPAEIAKYHRMRNQHLADLQKKRKPYGGELGPQSYKSWQMESYYLVRGLVEEEVEKFLDSYFRPNIGAAAARAAIEADQREWEKKRRALAESQAVQLLMEEILLEETRNLSWEAAKEFTDLCFFIHNKTDLHFMNQAEKVALDNEEGRNPSSHAYNLVTKAFRRLVADRNANRPDVWGHSQHLHLRGEPEPPPEEDEDEEEGAELIHFHDIIPLDLRQIEPRLGESRASRRKKDKYLRYMRREVQYFKEFSATNLTMNLASKCKGVYSARVSPNSHFVAIGTIHGDIIVYDFHFDPMRPIRAINNAARKDDAVLELAWSLDSSQLITVNQTGVLQVWSMLSGGVHRHDVHGLDIRPDDAGIVPELLTQSVVMEMENSDFMFQSGPLAESGAQSRDRLYGPVRAAFTPSLTMAGSQNAVCVALDNGDMLRCDLEQKIRSDERGSFKPLPLVIQPDVNVSDNKQRSELGQGISAELFRSHKHVVVLICFVDHLGDLVTVDQRGYIYIWKYSKKSLASRNPNPTPRERRDLSSYDWYQPHHKYKLDMAKTMYTPVSNAQPNIIFSDRHQDQGRQKSSHQLQRERSQVEQMVEQLNLGDPWHQEFIPQKSIFTQVFAPREKIPESGSIFHVIIRHALSQQLSTYLTRVYKPVKVPSTKFLSVLQTPDGSSILFLLLFPEYPPKEAHISIVILDLHTMKLKNWRRDIDIENDALYQQLLEEDAVACDITRSFGTTGSQYLFVNIAGQLSAYSMNTGLKVLRTEDPKFPINDGFDGLRISSRGYALAPSAQLAVSSTNNRFYVLAYTDEMSTKKLMNPLQISVLELADENTKGDRMLMRKALDIWKQHPPLPPSEIRVDNITTEMEDVQPVEVYIRSLVMDLVYGAMTQRSGGYMDAQMEALVMQDRLQHYEELLSQWEATRSPPPSPGGRSSGMRAPPSAAPSSRPPPSRAPPSSTSRQSKRGYRL